MEFFDWMGIPQAILGLFRFDVDESVASIIEMQMQVLVITLWIAAGLYLLGHLFGGFGLYKMAKRAGEKNAWMAFVPVLCTYLAGRLAGETSVFGVKVKRIGLYAAIAEVLYIAINIFTLTLSMLMMRPEWYELTRTETAAATYLGTELNVELMPSQYRWMPTALNVMNIIEIVWYFVTLFLFIVLFIAFFRKYYARSPLIMAFLCSILPVRGYVLFAVRNNTPVDYNAWMQERIRRMQQQQTQQYGTPYGGPYGGSYGPAGGAPAEPFSDTASGESAPPQNDDEPFSDL